MKKTSILLFILFSCIIKVSPIWQREIINYSRAQYKAGFQNWMLTQADNGWIYAANTDGLLEFDGVRWSLYRMDKNMTRSVKIVKNRIYVGGSSVFGFFEYNEIGLLTYNSLSANLDSWAGEVWNILQIDNMIYFISDNYVHIYNEAKNTTVAIRCGSKINSSTVFGDKILLGTSTGVMHISDQLRLISIEASKGIAQHKIVELVPVDQKLLIITARDGLYYLDNEVITKIQLAESFIQNNQIFSATVTGSKLILGSVQNGVLILDLKKQDSIEHINIKNGIINNTVLNTFIDRDGNLWLALDKGISYVNLNSAIQPLYANISPIGTGHCSVMYNGILYFGTNQGVYTFTANGDCKLLPGSEGQIWSMKIIDNKLFCTGDNNVTVISPGEQYSLGVNSVWEVHEVKEDKNKIVAGTYKGFTILEKRNGKWSYSHDIEKISNSMRGILEDGDEPYTFWYLKHDKIPTRIFLDSTLTKIKHEKQYDIAGTPIHHNRYLRWIDNNITITTDSGLYNYNRLTDSFGKYTQLESMLEGNTIYNHLSIDGSNGIWYSTDKTMKLLPYKDGGYNLKSLNIGAFIEQLTDNRQNIFHIDPTSAIIATDNGFSKIDLTKSVRDSIFPLQTHIRSLRSSKSDSILVYGNNTINIEIAYENNSIQIEYGTTAFSNNMDIKYVFRLKDNDKEWSNPTSNTSKEYTHLFEGDYVFEVVAIDPLNDEYSNLASIHFSILPPWYRSIYAYFTYALLFCSLMYIIYRKTFAKQKKIIYQQKVESAVKDQEIYELQNKNLKDELYYKTQELSGYILNIIRKNEILEDVKKKAIGVSKALDEESSRPIIKQKITRLIGQINNNIEKDKDFEVFQSNFDIVHQDFFKLLDEKIPDLTRNDKILCAYLNMNLASKEIAPLLNISIRGVEIGRYRLRKKMGLNRDVNLIEFLQNLTCGKR